MSLLLTVQNSLKRFEMTGPLRSIAIGAGIAFVIQFAGKIVGYFLQIVLARWMGPAEYGTFNYIFAWVAVIAMVGGLGFPEAILRFVPEYRASGDPKRLQGVIVWSQRFTLLVSTLLAILFASIATWLHSDSPPAVLWPYYMGALIIPLFAWFNLLSETFRSMHKVTIAYIPRQVLEPLLMIVTVMGAVLLFNRSAIYSQDALLADLCIFAVLIGGQQWFLHRTVAKELAELSTSTPTEDSAPPISWLAQHREWLAVALPLLLVAGYRIILNRSDILLLGMFVNAEDLGIYNAALIISSSISFVLVSVNTVFAPTVAAMYKRGELAELQRLVSTTAHWSFWPSLGLGLFLIFFAEPMLGLLGKEFTAGRWQLLIMISGHLVNSGVGSVGYLLSMTGHQRYIARVFGWTSIFSVFLFSGLIYLYGTLGAAIGASLIMAIRNLWLYRHVVKELQIYPSVLDALREQKGH